MLDFEKCHPIELSDLVRIGSKNDGGYILSNRQIDKTSALLSFGINDDWAFEDNFFKRKKIKIYAYDYSIKDSPFVTGKFAKTFIYIICFILLRNWALFYEHFKQFRLSKEFYKFFNKKNGVYYIPKFLGQYDDEKNVCFDTIFKNIGDINDLSVFVKMDIESAEYLCLPQVMPFLDKINGMVVEFHQLDIAGGKFENILDDLSSKFYIAHVHGNNYGHRIYKTNVPSIVEITFINKSLVSGNVALSKQNYPIESLDAPCNKFKEDYKLTFIN